MPLPPAFVINLDGSEARMASAAAQLTATGLAFQRVPAFDGRGLTPQEFPDYDAKAALAYMGRPMRGGEIGCYHSHLRAAQAVVNSGAPMGLVFEDDMQLVPGAAERLQALADWLAGRDDWDLVNLGANKHRIYSNLVQFGAHALTRAHYFPMMASGLLWKREGALAFLQAHDRIFAPVDNYFRHWQTRRDRGLAIWPPLVETTGAESDIFAGPVSRSREDRHPLYGLIKQRRLMADKLLALRHKYTRAR
ncbi:glycosyltransferase family 25 protein [Pararhodobacter sp. CCB-MM2]|uniref:glycosyltransferase family 25 protein n=1 Tax=Pararhodobacter sp. CCB-MM2 TaxID=1786003 RepID=UPI0008357F28|nr:glycosyltransferase family 25 protein [Pararhodobacter sp. CCB-MM2]